jgi:hypothetical protein
VKRRGAQTFPESVWAVLMPPLRLGQHEPVHESLQVAVPPRPGDEMPVVGHDAVRQESYGGSLTRLPQHRSNAA